MIANFFNKTKPVIIVNILILFAVLYAISTFLTQSVDFSFVEIGARVSLSVGFLFMLLVVNFILRKNNLTEDNSYTLLIVVLLLSSFNETFHSQLLYFSNLFLLFAFRKIYSLNSGLNTKQKLFDAGLWIGIATLIYDWSLLFLILVYLAMFIYRSVSFKNLFIPIVGFIAPVIVFFTYHFYFDQMEMFYNTFIFNYSLDFHSYNSLEYLVPFTLLTTLIIWCVLILSPKIILMSSSFKSAWQILIAHLIISIIVVVFSPIKNGSEVFFMILPSAVVITNYLQKTESTTFKNIILYLLLLVSVGVYFL